MLIRVHLSLAISVFLSPSTPRMLGARLGFTYYATYLTVASNAVSRENNPYNKVKSTHYNKYNTNTHLKQQFKVRTN
jgi:hypothetical protein